MPDIAATESNNRREPNKRQFAKRRWSNYSLNPERRYQALTTPCPLEPIHRKEAAP